MKNHTLEFGVLSISTIYFIYLTSSKSKLPPINSPDIQEIASKKFRKQKKWKF